MRASIADHGVTNEPVEQNPWKAEVTLMLRGSQAEGAGSRRSSKALPALASQSLAASPSPSLLTPFPNSQSLQGMPCTVC